MKYESISPKQAEIFTFPHEGYDALICDGAVRSGKTSLMTINFILWAMECFNGFNFGICGKTVQSVERNIIAPLQSVTSMTRKYIIRYLRSRSLLIVEQQDKTNYFYVFGGKDESSFQLIQGITLAGVLLDEVALMPQSFVEQAISRTLSIDTAKLWFNCNPEHPEHWFYKEWILQPEKHNAKHVHFLMTDNPSLSEKSIQRAVASFSGVFYDRYILGLWRKAEGLIYPHFDYEKHVISDAQIPKGNEYYISIDYGTSNPFSAGLWKLRDGVAYRIREYYFDSRKEGHQKTDEQYADEIEGLAGRGAISLCILDPSAASFKVCLRRRGFAVRDADNDVLPGIMNTSSALRHERIKIHESCKDLIRELGLYAWDEKSKEDRPIKEHDHACDDMRYFVRTVLRRDVYAFDGDITITDDEDNIIIGGKRLFRG